MDASKDAKDRDTEAEAQRETGRVAVHECSPEKIVFTEEGNTDGWIATDLTVALER